MTQQSRIGLAVFGAVGTLFLVMVLGVVALVASQRRASSKPTEPLTVAKAAAKSTTTSTRRREEPKPIEPKAVGPAPTDVRPTAPKDRKPVESKPIAKDDAPPKVPEQSPKLPPKTAPTAPSDEPPATPKPTPAKKDPTPVLPLGPDPRNWDLTDLADYLKKNGYPNLRTAKPTVPDTVYLILAGQEWSGDDVRSLGIFFPGIVTALDGGKNFDWPKYQRTLTDDNRDTTWGWGRFVFRGEAETLVRFQKAFK